MRGALAMLGMLGALAAGGCASSPTAMQMTYFPEGRAEDAALSWPVLPEVPRYRYAGQLIGAPNFRAARDEEPGVFVRALRWLVGIDERAEQARVLVRPQSGLADARGRVYVTDAGREAVFVFDEAQGLLHIWDTADRRARFLAPVGIAHGAGEEIYVADAELGRVVRLDRDGNPLGSFAEGVVERPTGLAHDPGSGLTYVADSGAHDIKVFDRHGRLVRTLGRHGSGPGEFNGPTHLALDRDRLVVSDTLNARVQVLGTRGEVLRIIGRRGLYVGNFTRPKGVTVDEDGNIYVVESYYDHLLVFDAEGRFLLPIGGTGAGIGRFFLPAGVWSDRNGRIFLADMFNGRVVVFQFLGD